MKTITKIRATALLLCGFLLVNATVPPTAPPDLEYDKEDVLSFFSEKYGEDRTLSTPKWGQTATWDYTATGDDEAGLIVIRNLEWLPIQNDPLVETKQYEYFHIDIFCNETTDFRIGFHSNYPINGNEVYFPAVTADQMVPGKWYSIEYPISDLKYDANDEETSTWILSNGSYANANLIRVGNGTDKYTYSDEIYVTNLVLFNGTPTCIGGIVRDESGIRSPKEDYGFRAFSVDNTLHIFAQEIINKIDIYDVTGKHVKSLTLNAPSSKLKISDLSSGIYIISANLINGQTVNSRILK